MDFGGGQMFTLMGNMLFFIFIFFVLNELWRWQDVYPDGQYVFFFLNVFVLNELWRWQDVYQDGVKGNML